jgi:translation initiation factor 1 (eIF-1/SUI1)
MIVIRSQSWGVMRLHMRIVFDKWRLGRYKVTHVECCCTRATRRELLQRMKRQIGCGGKLKWRGFVLQGNQVTAVTEFILKNDNHHHSDTTCEAAAESATSRRS